jgi:L-glutamine-phosphate cytidylyltransferase
MRAVILAAGRGGRLRGVTGNHPKCLARVGAVTLLERQVAALRRCGVDAITVVAGYHAADVRRVCRGVDFAHNARFASTNSMYSLWLVRQAIADGFLVLNADVLFHDQLLIDLLTARYEDALLVAPPPGGERAFTDEEMKVRVRGGRVVEIAKTIDPAEADGENIGIAKFGAAGAAVLIEEMNQLIGAGSHREWLPAGFAAFGRRRPLHVIDNRGFPWIEIDFPEDYWRACTDVLPAIEAAAAPSVALPRQGAASAASGRTSHV